MNHAIAAQDLDSEPAAYLLERRWFAVTSATRSLQSECDLLLEALKLAEAAWQRVSIGGSGIGARMRCFGARRDSGLAGIVACCAAPYTGYRTDISICFIMILNWPGR